MRVINIADYQYQDGGPTYRVVTPHTKELFTMQPLVDNVQLYPELADYDNPKVFKVEVTSEEERRQKTFERSDITGVDVGVAIGITVAVPFVGAFLALDTLFGDKEKEYAYWHYTARVHKRVYKGPLGWVWVPVTDVEFNSPKVLVKKPHRNNIGNRDPSDLQADIALNQLSDIIWEAKHGEPQTDISESSQPGNDKSEIKVDAYAADLPYDEYGPRFIPRESVGTGYFSKISNDEVLIGNVYSSKTLEKYTRNSRLQDQNGNRLEGDFMIIGFQTDATRRRYLRAPKEHQIILPYSSVRLLLKPTK